MVVAESHLPQLDPMGGQSDPTMPQVPAEAMRQDECLRQSPRTHVVQARCCQWVYLTTGLPKIQQGWKLAGLAMHAVSRVDDGCRRPGLVVRAQTEDTKRRRDDGRRMLGSRRQDESFSERQTTALRGRLKSDIDILASTEAMRKVNETSQIRVT